MPREDFDFVIDCIKKGFINTADYISHRVSFNNLEKEFPDFMNASYVVIKAMAEL